MTRCKCYSWAVSCLVLAALVISAQAQTSTPASTTNQQTYNAASPTVYDASTPSGGVPASPSPVYYTPGPTAASSPSPVYTPVSPSPVWTPAPTFTSTPAPTGQATPTTTPAWQASPSPSAGNASPSPTGRTAAPPTAAPASGRAPAPAPQVAATTMSALNATVRLIGPGVWPFGDTKQKAMVKALAASMNSITEADVTVLAAVQVVSFSSSGRRMLQAANDSATDVQVVLDAKIAERVGTVASDLSSAIAGGGLQGQLAAAGVATTSVSLLTASASLPATAQRCQFGSLAGFCIGASTPSASGKSVSTGVVVAAAAGAAVALLLLLVCVGVCCCRRRRAQQKENPAEASPRQARPFWYDMQQAQAGGQVGQAALPGLPLASVAPLAVPPTKTDSYRAVAEKYVPSAAAAKDVEANVKAPEQEDDEPQGGGNWTNGLGGLLSRLRTATSTATSTVGSESMSGEAATRLAAANVQLADFSRRLTEDKLAATVARLVLAHQQRANRLSAPAGEAARVSAQVQAAMSFLAANPTFAGKYKLETGKVTGNNSIMVLGTLAAAPQRKIAAKFFLDRDAFLHERQAYRELASDEFVAGVLDVFEAGELGDVAGSMSNPAVIVMERGDYTLADFLAKQVGQQAARRGLGARGLLVQLCEALNFLHARGVTHRAIRPANIMWFSAPPRWRLIDFSAWARRAADATLEYPLRYSAPEVVAADALCLEEARGMGGTGARASFPAHPASDMWSVGVVAWELLTGAPLFGPEFSDDDVARMLLGARELPFEADPSLWILFDDLQAQQLVRGLLVRSPEERLSVTRTLTLALQMAQ